MPPGSSRPPARAAVALDATAPMPERARHEQISNVGVMMGDAAACRDSTARSRSRSAALARITSSRRTRWWASPPPARDQGPRRASRPAPRRRGQHRGPVEPARTAARSVHTRIAERTPRTSDQGVRLRLGRRRTTQPLADRIETRGLAKLRIGSLVTVAPCFRYVGAHRPGDCRAVAGDRDVAGRSRVAADPHDPGVAERSHVAPGVSRRKRS
jgi:hypothetical protein